MRLQLLWLQIIFSCSFVLNSKFLAGSMHLMSTVTRSFLYLSSYTVIPFFLFHFNYSFHKHDISSDSFTSVVQYFLSPVLVAHGFFPALLSNLLFMVAISYYHYLNFLGYDGTLFFRFQELHFLCICVQYGDRILHFTAVLPFLDRTTFFLYPIGLVIILSPFSKCLLRYCFELTPRQLSQHIPLVLQWY
jgi:hypothetical protein